MNMCEEIAFKWEVLKKTLEIIKEVNQINISESKTTIIKIKNSMDKQEELSCSWRENQWIQRQLGRRKEFRIKHLFLKAWKNTKKKNALRE